jgi:hypothetical protein
MKFATGLAAAGALLLAATAAFHASGLAGVRKAAEDSALDPMLESIFTPLWLFPTTHWLFVAAVGLIAALRHSPAARLILAMCGLVIAVDAGLLFLHVGPFIGEAMLGGAALLFIAAAAARRRLDA